jgi:methylenetetrahydrofolate reductase (NADPH)
VAGGAPGLHFYTLNRAKPTLAILERLDRTVANSHRQT